MSIVHERSELARRLASGTSMMLASLLLTASVNGADPLRSALSRYATWRGGTALSNLNEVVESGMISDGKLHGSVTIIENADGDLSEELQVGPLATDLDSNRNQGSYTNLSAQRLPLSPAERSFAQDEATLLFPGFLRNRTGTKLVRNEQYAGRVCDVVHTTSAFGAAYDFVFVPNTGELLSIRMRRDGSTRVLTFGDWRVMDGIRWPFEMKERGDGVLGPLDDEPVDMIFDKVQVNPSAFERPRRDPSDRMSPSFPAGTHETGWVPFRLVNDLITLPVMVNGHPTEAILDSGASISVLDTKFAASIGLKSIGASSVEGQGGSASLSYLTELSVIVSNLDFRRLTAGAIDLSPLKALGSQPISMLLGAEAFDQMVVDIDYQNRRLAFRQPGADRSIDKDRAILLGSLNGAFSVPVSVEDAPEIPVLLDTGSDGTFQIFPAYWSANKLLAGRRATTAIGGGVGGSRSHQVADISNLRIAGTVLRAIPTSFDQAGTPVSDETLILGNLGEPVLKRFRLVVDVPDGRIAFLSTRSTMTAFPRNLIGIETAADGSAARVFFVMPGSPAAAAGMRIGDKIVAVDGRPVKGASNEVWQEGRAGTSVILKLANGRQQTIQRANFY